MHRIENPGVVDVDKWSEMVNCGRRVLYRSFSCVVNATYEIQSQVKCSPAGT